MAGAHDTRNDTMHTAHTIRRMMHNIQSEHMTVNDRVLAHCMYGTGE